MDDLAIWICGWNDQKISEIEKQFKNWKYPHVFTDSRQDSSEPVKHNRCIDISIEEGFKYILFTDNDVEWRYSETIPTMYEYITRHSECGLIRPWIEGEPAQSSAEPTPKYVEDGTGWMFRLGYAKMDTEFLFAGFQDVDFGNEMEYQGQPCYNDRRYPVYHSPAQSRNWSSFRQAFNKRNKLLLDFKWYKVGRDKWKGIDAYNASVPLEEQIPNLYQLAGMKQEQHWTFAESIDPEHTQIYIKDGKTDWPNMFWRNPLVVGYSTREEFLKIHRYS